MEKSYNPVLDELFQGGVPVELSASDPDTVEARWLLTEGGCCYTPRGHSEPLDAGGSVYWRLDRSGFAHTAVILWD